MKFLNTVGSKGLVSVWNSLDAQSTCLLTYSVFITYIIPYNIPSFEPDAKNIKIRHQAQGRLFAFKSLA